MRIKFTLLGLGLLALIGVTIHLTPPPTSPSTSTASTLPKVSLDTQFVNFVVPKASAKFSLSGFFSKPPTISNATDDSLARQETEIINLTNAYRQANRLRPLSYNPTLASAARQWAQTMGDSNYFRHSDNVPPPGYNGNCWGENIEAGRATAQQAVDAWKASQKHNENLLHTCYTEIGVGVASAPNSTNKIYRVQKFGARPGTGSTYVPPPSNPTAPTYPQQPVTPPQQPVTPPQQPTNPNANCPWYNPLCNTQQPVTPPQQPVIPQNPTTPTNGITTSASDAQKVFQLVNNTRTQRNLTALRWDNRIVSASERHAIDQANRKYYSHISPERTDGLARMKSAGYNATAWGENINAGSATPQENVNAWLGSTVHLNNILNPNVTDTGVGVAYINPGVNVVYNGVTYYSVRSFYVQDFGAGGGTTTTTPPQQPVTPPQQPVIPPKPQSITPPQPQPVTPPQQPIAPPQQPVTPQNPQTPPQQPNTSTSVINTTTSNPSVYLGLTPDQIRCKRYGIFCSTPTTPNTSTNTINTVDNTATTPTTSTSVVSTTETPTATTTLDNCTYWGYDCPKTPTSVTPPVVPPTTSTNNLDTVDTPTTTTNYTSELDPAADGRKLFDQINALRKEKGLKEIKSNEKLLKVAQSFAQSMADNKFFDHKGPDGSTPESRVKVAGYNATIINELIGGAFPNAESTLKAWKENKDLLDKLVNDKLADGAVGYVYVPGSTYLHYWVALLAAPGATESTNIDNLVTSTTATETLTDTARGLTFSVKEPDGKNDTVITGQTFNIGYSLKDDQGVSTVSFYYDSDNVGYDGIMINACVNKPEGQDQLCNWDTKNLAPRTYYLYALISNEQSTRKVYLTNPITVAPDTSTTTTSTNKLDTTDTDTKSFRVGFIATFCQRIGYSLKICEKYKPKQ
jgi:uncharacterized protein YkwD